jgi:hypothetical protein
VDHPKGGRDDHANSVCGVAALLGADAAGWMRSENLKPIIAKLAMMGPYRRPLGERRPDVRIGERQAAILQRSRGF